MRSRTLGWTRAALHVGLALFFLSMFTFDFWGWGRLFDWIQLRIAADVAAAVLVGSVLLGGALRARTLGVGPVDLPLAAFIAAAAISAVFAGDKAGVLEPVIIVVLVTVWFKLLSHSRAGWALAERPLLFLLVASAGFALRVLYEFIDWYAGTPTSGQGHVTWLSAGAGVLPQGMPYFGLASGATAVGGYLAMLAPPALAWLLLTEHRKTRVLLFGWVALAGTAIWLAQSRSGWLAAAAGCLVLFALAGSRRPTGFGARVAPFLAPAGAALVAVTLLVTITVRGPSTLTRVFIWGDALRHWLDNPLLGAGPGNFVYTQLVHRPDIPLGSLFWQAHSLPLHLLSVLGITGVAAAAWLLVVAIRALHRVWREATGPRRTLVAGYSAGLGAFLIWNAADVRADSFLLWGAAAALLALAIRSPEPVREAIETNGGRASPAYRTLLVVLAASFGAVLLLLERDHLPMNQAARMADDERWEEAAALLHAAAPTSTVGEFYRWQEAYLEARGGDWQRADRDFRALEGHRGWAEQLANAAYAASEAGDSQRAFALAQRALALSPLEARYPLLLARLHQAQAHEPEAAYFYGIALGLEPRWLLSTYWTSGPGASIRERAVDEAVQWLASTGDLVPAARSANLAEIYLTLERVTEAEEVSKKALASLKGGEGVALAAEVGTLLEGSVRDVVARERALFSHAQGPALFYNLLGTAALKRDDVNAAEEAFGRAAKEAFSYSATRVGLSTVALRRGDVPAALREARLAVIYRGEREAQAALGRALVASGQVAEARVHLQLGAQATRAYTTWYGLLAYKRREILPNLLPEVQDLAPDADIETVQRELALLP